MSRRHFSVVAVMLVLCGVAKMYAQGPARQVEVNERFTVGGVAVREGTLWLYARESPYLSPDTRVEIARIVNGVATIHLDASMVDGMLSDFSDRRTGQFFVALHVFGLAWFRTPDFDEPLTNLRDAVQHLGTPSVRSVRGQVIDVPPPVKQSIQAFDQNDSPLAGLELRIHTFINIAGRCEVRTTFAVNGIDPAQDDAYRVVTDVDGRAEFVAPLTQLTVRVEHYDVSPSVSFIPQLTRLMDVEVDASATHTIRIHTRAPDRPFTVFLLKPDGTPLADAVLIGYEPVGGCSGASDGPVGTTNADGKVEALFAPEHISRMWFQFAESDGLLAADAARRDLTDDELLSLFVDGTLTIEWAGPAPADPKR